MGYVDNEWNAISSLYLLRQFMYGHESSSHVPIINQEILLARLLVARSTTAVVAARTAGAGGLISPARLGANQLSGEVSIYASHVADQLGDPKRWDDRRTMWERSLPEHA